MKEILRISILLLFTMFLGLTESNMMIYKGVDVVDNNVYTDRIEKVEKSGNYITKDSVSSDVPKPEYTIIRVSKSIVKRLLKFSKDIFLVALEKNPKFILSLFGSCVSMFSFLKYAYWFQGNNPIIYVKKMIDDGRPLSEILNYWNDNNLDKGYAEYELNEQEQKNLLRELKKKFFKMATNGSNNSEEDKKIAHELLGRTNNLLRELERQTKSL